MKNILIVDDEHSIRQGLIENFDWHKLGYHIIGEASDGEQALKIIKETHPDIVLTDIMMPKMTGIELTKYLTSMYPDIVVIILSNYSDFSYVKNALVNGAKDYLLKATISEALLAESLSKITVKQQHQTEYFSLDRLIKKALLQQLNIQEQQFITTHLPYPNSFLIVSDLLNLTTQEQESIEKQLNSLLPDSYIISEQIRLHQIFIINTSDTKEALLDKINSMTIPNFFGCLSDSLVSMTNLKIIIEQLALKLPVRFNLSTVNLITEEQAIQAQSLPAFDMTYFQGLLAERNELQALNYIRLHIDAIKPLILEEMSVKNQFIGIFYQLYTYFGNNYPVFVDVNLEKSKLLSDLTTPLTFIDLLKRIESKITFFEHYVTEQQANQDTQFKNQLIDYVTEHLSDKLTLKQVAEFFHFNYSYFSSYFSRLFDTTFVDFITQVRLEKAKKLLEQNELNISEIAELTGFSDVNYFSKVFKKHIGTSPTSYRRKWQ